MLAKKPVIRTNVKKSKRKDLEQLKLPNYKNKGIQAEGILPITKRL
jgi:hypothetical protein